MLGNTIALILLAALGCIALRSYGDLANLRRQTDAAWAQINAQLARRSELLADLSKAIHERSKPNEGSDGENPALVGVRMHELVVELAKAEEKIEFARKYYNDIVATYDERLKAFPHSMIALGLRLRPKELLELSLPADTFAARDIPA